MSAPQPGREAARLPSLAERGERGRGWRVAEQAPDVRGALVTMLHDVLVFIVAIIQVYKDFELVLAQIVLCFDAKFVMYPLGVLKEIRDEMRSSYRLSSSICVVTTRQESHLNLFEQVIVKDTTTRPVFSIQLKFPVVDRVLGPLSQSRPTDEFSHIIVCPLGSGSFPGLQFELNEVHEQRRRGMLIFVIQVSFLHLELSAAFAAGKVAALHECDVQQLQLVRHGAEKFYSP